MRELVVNCFAKVLTACAFYDELLGSAAIVAIFTMVLGGLWLFT